MPISDYFSGQKVTIKKGQEPIYEKIPAKYNFADLLRSAAGWIKQKASPLFKSGNQNVQGSNNIPSPIPPAPTASPAPYVPKITVPTDKGDYAIPPKYSQMLLNSFDDIKEATNSARMLLHPMEMTLSDDEQARIRASGQEVYPNRGENPELLDVIDVPNNDGSIDRGLTRINSATFAEMLGNDYWGRRMGKKGIGNWEDMNDPQKNIDMARLRLEYGNWDSENQRIKKNPNYMPWYAAPKDLRFR